MNGEAREWARLPGGGGLGRAGLAGGRRLRWAGMGAGEGSGLSTGGTHAEEGTHICYVGRLEVCLKLKTQSLQRRIRVSVPTLLSSA